MGRGQWWSMSDLKYPPKRESYNHSNPTLKSHKVLILLTVRWTPSYFLYAFCMIDASQPSLTRTTTQEEISNQILPQSHSIGVNPSKWKWTTNPIAMQNAQKPKEHSITKLNNLKVSLLWSKSTNGLNDAIFSNHKVSNLCRIKLPKLTQIALEEWEIASPTTRFLREKQKDRKRVSKNNKETPFSLTQFPKSPQPSSNQSNTLNLLYLTSETRNITIVTVT